MYKCECGFSSDRQDVCPDCDKLLECDCSDIEWDRINTHYGDRDFYAKINIDFCGCCGDIKHLEVV